MKKIKITAIILLLCTAISAFSGCTELVSKFYPYETGTDTYPFTPVTGEEGEAFFRDFDGNTINMPEAPEKIVSLSSVATEIISGIGAARYITALDSSSASLECAPINAELITIVTPAEDIIAMDPDLLFYSENSTYKNVVEKVKEAGILTVRIPFYGNVETAEANIRFISSLLYRENYGTRVIEEMRTEINRIKTAAAYLDVRRTAYIEYIMDNYASGDDMLSELCSYAGIDNIFAGREGEFTVSVSEIAEKDPDVIISGYLGSKKEETIRKRPGLETTKAIKENKIYSVNVADALRPTQNIVNALKTIAITVGTINE